MGFESQTKTTEQLFLEQLKSRGFEEDEALGYGLTMMSPESAHEAFGWPTGPCLRIVYFEPNGEPMLDYLRVRRLLGDKPKYVCQKCSTTQIYLAPHQLVSYNDMVRDRSVQIIITEGEFKALAISRALRAEKNNNYYVIGLQGVDQFGASDKSRMHKVLSAISWKDRDVFIWYDFDGTSPEGDPKVEVQNAEARLASLLALYGANVLIGRIGRMAKHKEFKYAIDDYILEGNSISGLLEDATMYTEEIAMTAGSRLQALYEYRSKFALIDGFHVNLRTMQQLPLSRQLVQHGHLQFTETVMRNGQPVPKTFKTADVYSSWVRALRLDGIGFDPHRQGELITSDMKLNTFKDWAHEPLEGDVDPYLQLLAMLFRNDEYVDYFLNWAAQLFQKPWEKNHTVPMLVGREEGTGKSLALDTLARTMGVDAGMPGHIGGPEELFSNFNGHLLGKILFVANEVGTESGKDAKRFKHFVTGSEVLINTKYGNQIVVPNYINLAITSNIMAPLKVDGSGRREALIAVHGSKSSNLIVCQRLVRWLDHEHGHGKLLGWLLDRDISNFDPHVAGPETLAKQNAAEMSRSYPDIVADAMIERIEAVLGCYDIILLTNEQADWFASETEHRKLAIKPKQALLRRGYIIDGNLPVKVDGTTAKYVVIFRREARYEVDLDAQYAELRRRYGWTAKRARDCTAVFQNYLNSGQVPQWKMD